MDVIRPIQRKSLFNSFIIGSVLGDATMRGNTTTRRASLRFLQKRTGYLDWKVAMCRNYIWPDRHERVDNGAYGAKVAYYRAQRKLFYIWRMLYSTGKKRVTWKILKKLTPLGIAVWFMDDGSLVLRGKRSGTIRSREIHFSTHSFTVGENKIIIQYFQSVWGVEFRLTSERGRPRIWCNTRNTHKFLDIVGTIVSQVPEMGYKADMKYVRGPNWT